MRLATATLIKHRTEDGTVELFEDVPLGKEYQVDMDSIQMADFYNVELQRNHSKRVVQVWEFGVPVGWFACELLRLPDA